MGWLFTGSADCRGGQRYKSRGLRETLVLFTGFWRSEETGREAEEEEKACMKRIPFPRSLGVLPQFSDITAAGRRTEFDGVLYVLGEDLIEERKFRKKMGFWRSVDRIWFENLVSFGNCEGFVVELVLLA